MDIPYHQKFKLLTTIKDVECWNFTGGVVADLPEGAFVELEYAASTTATVVRVADGRGIICNHGERGHRFIVPNSVLGPAIGQELPERTRDVVGDIIRFENGEMGEDEIRGFLQGLYDDGILQSLQGSYQRAYQHYCVNYRKEACV